VEKYCITVYATDEYNTRVLMARYPRLQTHTQNIIALLLRQWLHERASLLRCTCIVCIVIIFVSPLNAELNPICHLLALLGGATIVVISRLRDNGLTAEARTCSG
jgi:hypothetical protein